MNLTVTLPDDIATRLAADGADLGRRALEALALDGYRTGRLTRPELRRALGYGTGAELNGFLKEHGVDESMTIEEFEQQRRTLDRLGI
ncbi:UPF0175 family protein [Acidisphaera sp. S103]|uniref:UPF0175 family protein n=1 Tax=Acidisphaera sp. S103 TaxID=1747223 RepID=UPI00131BCF21|nr:UPF0175 family protein [Acidisphaera sp. S103]